MSTRLPSKYACKGNGPYQSSVGGSDWKTDVGLTFTAPYDIMNITIQTGFWQPLYYQILTETSRRLQPSTGNIWI
ncbi:MAG: hypothetical protein QXI59_05545 [Candidatus Bathyarchaeia archaeon]